MDPSLVILKYFGLETGRVVCSAIIWRFGRTVARSIRWVRDGVICACGCVLGSIDGRVLRGAKTKVAGSS